MSEHIADIIQTYSDRLFRYAMKIVGDRETAKDITQEVLIKFCSSADNIRDHSKVEAYLYRATCNRAFNHVRDRNRRDSGSRRYAEEFDTPTPTQPDADLERQQTTDMLRESIATLSARQRQTVTLRFWGEKTIAEIASVMSVSEGSVKVYLTRGLQKLKSRLIQTVGKEQV